MKTFAAECADRKKQQKNKPTTKPRSEKHRRIIRVIKTTTNDTIVASPPSPAHPADRYARSPKNAQYMLAR